MYQEDPSPLDSNCNCYACKNHSRAYLRHLFRCQEATCAALMSIHNIKFLIDFAKACRKAILNDEFDEFYAQHYPLLVKQ